MTYAGSQEKCLRIMAKKFSLALEGKLASHG